MEGFFNLYLSCDNRITFPLVLTGFQLITSGLETAPLLRALAEAPELWLENVRRQLTKGSPHKDTSSIFLRWPEDQSLPAVFTALDAIDYPALENLPEARRLIGQVLQALGAKELGRVMIVSLSAGGRITPHVDEGAYADHFERFHIPLHAAFGNSFFVEQKSGAGEYTYMRDGELWWFNHKRRHWAQNDSLEPRVHLIVDCVSSRFHREREL